MSFIQATPQQIAPPKHHQVLVNQLEKQLNAQLLTPVCTSLPSMFQVAHSAEARKEVRRMQCTMFMFLVSACASMTASSGPKQS